MEPIGLGPESAAEVAAFTRVACPFDPLSRATVARTLFDDPDRSTVLGSYDGGLVAVGAGVVRGERGFVKFLATHPRLRRRGLARLLLDRLEAFARKHGATTMEIGTSAPVYLVPGVDVRLTEAVVFFEDQGYERFFEAVNMSTRLVDLPEPPLPATLAGPEDFERLRPWVEREHPHWLFELRRGVELGRCFVHGDLGFACYDVNRDGWFGPIATRSDVRAKGVGTSTLLACLHAMRALGYERVTIAWATAFPFYLKTIGARIDRVFWWYRRKL